MKAFEIGEIYEEEGKKIININPLPENFCSFDCVFCPLGRTVTKTDKTFIFPETMDFISRLTDVLKNNSIDYVFVNPDGESLANAEMYDVVMA